MGGMDGLWRVCESGLCPLFRADTLTGWLRADRLDFYPAFVSFMKDIEPSEKTGFW